MTPAVALLMGLGHLAALGVIVLVLAALEVGQRVSERRRRECRRRCATCAIERELAGK